MKIYIHAPNVHQGGGKVLLEYLFSNVPFNTQCILDSRMVRSHANNLKEIYSVKPTFFSRLKGEVMLAKYAKAGDTVLCFGNLPPLFKTHAKVLVFLQNRYLFGSHDLSGFSVRIRLRLLVERWWFKSLMKINYSVIVQTPTMKRELKNCLGLDAVILPICDTALYDRFSKNIVKRTVEFDFIYVSSAESHKNHSTLLDAWIMLASHGLKPSLVLTVSRDSAIHDLIEQKKIEFDLNIINFGIVDHAQVVHLYQRSNTLIFPSKIESFGLPLIEAKGFGLSVLASELDYVRDVVEPDQTFNPESAVSIARAVMRHLGVGHQIVKPISAKAFLHSIQDLDSK